MQNHLTQSFFRFSRFLASLFLATTLALLIGCGGGGGGGGGLGGGSTGGGTTGGTTGGGTGGTPTPTAGALQLLVGSQQMPSSATATTTLTAVVLDVNRQTMAGQTVSFSTTDLSASISNPNPVTGPNGTAAATLNIGSSSANREITVTAMVGSISDSNMVSVTGTKIVINGNASLSSGAIGSYIISVKDSTGAALQGITLAVKSQNNNPIVLTPATGITNSLGQITAAVTATNAGSGTDVLTVTGAGVSQTQTLAINTTNFAFATVNGNPITTNTPEIVVATPTPITVNWTNSGAPVAGTVSFSATRGAFSPTSATTATGIATTAVSSSSTGEAILTAKGTVGGNPATTLNVVFITTSASSINAQALPSTVETNPPGSKTHQSVIQVVVRDASNNLVRNAVVDFSLTADPSGGSLDSGTATTDVSGTASVNYIAGNTSSSTNGVSINATVSSIIIGGVAVNIAPITAAVNLTVASQALFVRLGTNDQISSSGNFYSKTYSALVADAAGNPAPDGTTVAFVVRPASGAFAFAKGAYISGSGWGLDIANTAPTYGTITLCPREDLLYNGIVCSSSFTSTCNIDVNGNTILDPDGVAIVNASATTQNGIADATVTYLQDHATWVMVDLMATAVTGANDPPAIVTFILPAPVGAFTNTSVAPPFAVSPYGRGATSPINNAVCTNTN